MAGAPRQLFSRHGSVTRRSDASGLRAWFAWCHEDGLLALTVTPRHVELWVRDMEEGRGLATSTIARRLSTVCGFYRFATLDGFVERNPAEFVRRPKVDQESTTLDLNGLGDERSPGAAARRRR